jgi:hypothetical protein
VGPLEAVTKSPALPPGGARSSRHGGAKWSRPSQSYRGFLKLLERESEAQVDQLSLLDKVFRDRLAMRQARSGRSKRTRSVYREALAPLMGQIGNKPLRERRGVRHNWERNPLAPRLAPGEERRSPDRPSDLEPVSGFEPLTVRLQGGCSAN